MAEEFANLFTTSLADAGGITAGATSLTLASSGGAPSAPFRIKLNNELIRVGSRTGTACSSLTRGLEGTTAASHNQGTPIRHVVTAGTLYATRIEQGTFASRLASSLEREGRGYWPTDGFGLGRDTGAGWTSFGLVQAWTTPPSSGWTSVNLGSSSVLTDLDSQGLTGGAVGNTTNIVARVRSAPSVPYTITACLSFVGFHKAFQGFGLCFRQSSDGRLHLFDLVAADLGLTTFTIRSGTFTDPTTFNANYQSDKWSFTTPIWLRIADNNTNRVLSIGNGVDWITYHSVTRTDFLTADQVGFHMSTQNAATPNYAPIVRVHSWVES